MKEAPLIDSYPQKTKIGGERREAIGRGGVDEYEFV